MKTNYQKKTDELLSQLKGRPRLLLHVCCAPCASYVIEYLSEYFDITLYYYNPNIRPYDEYRKRLDNIRLLLAGMDMEKIPLAVPDYEKEKFESVYSGRENIPEGGSRCTLCFELRLSESAKYAAEHGFDYFCSTLSISPHKNAELLNTIGEKYSREYGVKWLPNDFKKLDGYKRSIELSHKHGIYRQNYCGCTPNPEE